MLCLSRLNGRAAGVCLIAQRGRIVIDSWLDREPCGRLRFGSRVSYRLCQIWQDLTDSSSYHVLHAFYMFYLHCNTLFAQSRLIGLGLISLDLFSLLMLYVYLAMTNRSYVYIGRARSIQVVTCCGFELVKCKWALTELGIVRQMQAFGLLQSQSSGGLEFDSI